MECGPLLHDGFWFFNTCNLRQERMEAQCHQDINPWSVLVKLGGA